MKNIIAILFNWVSLFFASKDSAEAILQEPIPDPEQVEPIALEPSLPAEKTLTERIDENWLARLAKTLKMTLTKAQGDAVRLIVHECEKQGVTDFRQIAYILGTVYHECRFKSIKEQRANPNGNADQRHVYALQEAYWYTGFYGRGFSQLTWEDNYRKFSPVVGIDIVKYPEKVMIPAIGAKILVFGMKNGSFTTKGTALKSSNNLSKYFNATTTNWYDARRIVNGTFRAEMVAEAAQKILPLLNTEPAA